MAEQQTPAEQQAPTAEEQQQATQVAQAGAAAAAGGQDPAQAMKDERDRTGFKMSDEDIERVAARLSELSIDAMQQRGAFDPPPERVQAPPPTAAPAPPGEAQPEQQPDEPAGPPPAPEKRTPAHRFFGVS